MPELDDMDKGIEKPNGDALLLALSSKPIPPKAGGGTSPNQILQTRVIAYARKDKGARSALLAWFYDQFLHGWWTCYRPKGTGNEQHTASHDQLWLQGVVAALWLAKVAGHDDIEDAADRWMLGYEALNCACEVPGGHVVVGGKRTFTGHYWSSYRDDVHRAMRGIDPPTHGRDWPRDRSEIGPTLVRRLLKQGHKFAGAVDLKPETCAAEMPRLVERLVVQRYANGHVASMPDAQWLAKDDTRMGWALYDRRDHEGYDTTSPPTGDLGPLLATIESKAAS
jgi:hypothetical protein